MGVITGRLTTCVSCRSRARRMEYGPAEWNKTEEERLDACAGGWGGCRFGEATAHVVFEKSGDCFGQVKLAAAEFFFKLGAGRI